MSRKAWQSAKGILLRHWKIKAIFILTWMALAAFSSGDRITDYAHNPQPSWFFFSTLPALLICMAWANQAEIIRSGRSGVAKYAKWLGHVIGDLTAFALVVFVAWVALALPGTFSGYDYSRRIFNSKAILSASPLRMDIERAAEKSGKIAGSGRGLRPVPPTSVIDFSYVGEDGSIFLHSQKTESTVLLVPRMANGKVQWDCRGFPESAMPGSCRGGYLPDPFSASAETTSEKFTCPDPERKAMSVVPPPPPKPVSDR